MPPFDPFAALRAQLGPIVAPFGLYPFAQAGSSSLAYSEALEAAYGMGLVVLCPLHHERLQPRCPVCGGRLGVGGEMTWGEEP